MQVHSGIRGFGGAGEGQAQSIPRFTEPSSERFASSESPIEVFVVSFYTYLYKDAGTWVGDQDDLTKNHYLAGSQ